MEIYETTCLMEIWLSSGFKRLIVMIEGNIYIPSCPKINQLK